MYEDFSSGGARGGLLEEQTPIDIIEPRREIPNCIPTSVMVSAMGFKLRV